MVVRLRGEAATARQLAIARAELRTRAEADEGARLENEPDGYSPAKGRSKISSLARAVAAAGTHVPRVATRVVAQETQRAASTTAAVRLVTRIVIGFNLFLSFDI